MPAPNPLHKQLPILAAALLAVVVYAVTLNGTYVYDDVKIVHTDPRVLEPARLWQLWTQPYFAQSVDKLYRPLVSTSFALENHLHGDRPWVFHLVNILLHAAVSAAVALLTIRLAGPAAGWFAGLLFAVHPVHVEAVAGLVGRAESACALAILIGLYLFLRDGPIGRARGIAICVCFLVALLSKEQGVLFPLLLAVAYPVRFRGKLSPEDRARIKLLAVALCWMLAAYFLLRERVASLSWDRNRLDWYVNPMIRSRGLDRILMPIALLGRYAMLLVFPRHLSIDYGGWIIGWTTSPRDPYLWLGFAALAAWIIAAAITWKRRHFPMLFCLLALAISYGIIGNVVALIGTIFADRLMYLPSAFFLIAIGIALSKIPARALAPIVILLAIFGGVQTFAYARLWNDPITLYQATLRNYPKSERAYLLLCNAHQDRAEWAEALAVAHQACAAVPERWEPYVMCIQAELAVGNYAGATAAADEGLNHVSKDEKLVFIQWKELIAKQKAEAGK